MIKRSVSAVLLSGAFVFSGAVFADSLEFSKSVVDSYKMGANSVKAMMTMEDGKKHKTEVQLQDNVLLKDLASGNLIYVKKHNEVFEVTNATTAADGTTTVDVKTTHLFVGHHKMHKDHNDTMKNNADQAPKTNSSY